ncbi:MAG TPA: adenosylcobinamide-GDP ribazoletransferase [Jatrophihabitantaceae bacterium]|jgi:adenosylcobinamide-GDP ribazoletransferase
MRTALALFTLVPVRATTALTRSHAVAALRWFPLIGAALGAAAALPLAAIREWAAHATLLGAVLAVTLLAVGSRGLHLDGLADTADGLASRAPAERALEIMRRSDIGPFGVLAIVFAVLVDVAALTALDASSWRPVAALAVAAATGRLAVVHAAHRRVPSARSSGFGAYVASSVSTPLAVVETVAVLAGGAGLAAAVHASVLGWLVAQAGALLVTAGVRRHTTRRLGGVTGDVFGALVEIGTALTLTGLALG